MMLGVYFSNGNKAIFDSKEVSFMQGGNCFSFAEGQPEHMNYASMVEDGRVVVNWDNVCFVKEHTFREDDE